MILLLRCPKCKHEMKYESRDSIITKKRKTCVYCGKNFRVGDSIVRQGKEIIS